MASNIVPRMTNLISQLMMQSSCIAMWTFCSGDRFSIQSTKRRRMRNGTSLSKKATRMNQERTWKWKQSRSMSIKRYGLRSGLIAQGIQRISRTTLESDFHTGRRPSLARCNWETSPWHRCNWLTWWSHRRLSTCLGIVFKKSSRMNQRSRGRLLTHMVTSTSWKQSSKMEMSQTLSMYFLPLRRSFSSIKRARHTS